MRTLNVIFDDEEFRILSKIKGKRSWHDFILTLNLKGDDIGDKS